MINREIYQRDPVKHKLVNEGVARVSDDRTSQAMAVLRYELETFVCEGEYEKGLELIFETYLNNLEEAQQPGVWISGFYGSGKSHLVKMLRALWIDIIFDDGATARSIAKLPQNISDLLKELSTQAKRYGGLHAASGTLGSGARGSVRLALLRIVFKSVDLPEKYPVARFVMWLKNEGIYDSIKERVEENDFDWDEELDNFYVAEGLYEALCHFKPNVFSPSLSSSDILTKIYPNVQDISNDEMVKAIRHALNKNGKFPLTLMALDEVQQYIGEDIQRSTDVQEVVETCCKNFGGKLLFIGTGQTAVTGTSNLKKLEGRFTIRIELSDNDVEAVIRNVILAKKPSAISSIEQTMQSNLGEISRHLSETTIRHQQDDINYFAQDYPILPVRRRFWENTLRVLDQTGTASQLRNQLSMVHKVIQTNLSEPLGHVAPADYIYFDSADKLLQSRILPRKVHEVTLNWRNGTEDERLVARACGLVFLINKLSDSNTEIGIKATVETIADLIVENLLEGSSTLRSKLPDLLDNCILLMKVEDEYRIQTEESVAWTNEFLNQRSILVNEAHRIHAERDERMRSQFATIIKKISLTQGVAKVSRKIYSVFNSQLPSDHTEKVYVWVRDGWSIEEDSVHADARQARNISPTIFVYIPRWSADELRHNIIDYKASKATLERRGIPIIPEGIEARAAMETIFNVADRRIQELLDEAFSEAHVYQGGGNEIIGTSMQENIIEAAYNALDRLYPQFDMADNIGWGTVYKRAKQGSPEALKAVGYDGDPSNNRICKTILAFIASGKKGIEIRTNFENAPFGWPRDAVDGGIQVLLMAGLILAQDERGKNVPPMELERRSIGKIIFKIESATVSTAQKIQIRRLFHTVGVQTKPSEELTNVPLFLQKMQELAESAGGDAPKPSTSDMSALEGIRLSAGNEQLLAIYNLHEELEKDFDEWSQLAAKIRKQWPHWIELQELLHSASDFKIAEETRQQAKVIEDQRLLLAEPDLIRPLVKSLSDALRKELMDSYQRYNSELYRRMQVLKIDSSWQELPDDTHEEILRQCEITPMSEPLVRNHIELVKELDKNPLHIWNDRIDALAGRFARAREIAAKELEPKTQTVDIPRRTIRTDEDIDTWIEDVKLQLKTALKKGPIIIR